MKLLVWVLNTQESCYYQKHRLLVSMQDGMLEINICYFKLAGYNETGSLVNKR